MHAGLKGEVVNFGLEMDFFLLFQGGRGEGIGARLAMDRCRPGNGDGFLAVGFLAKNAIRSALVWVWLL